MIICVAAGCPPKIYLGEGILVPILAPGIEQVFKEQ